MQPFNDALLAMLLDFPWSAASPQDQLLILSLITRTPRWDPERKNLPLGPSQKQIDFFRRELRKGLDLLRRGEEWELPQAREAIVDLRRRGHASATDGLWHFYNGSDSTILIRSAVAIIGDRWRDIRWCKNPRCGRPFVRRGKLQYCSPAHAQRTRYERWKSRERRPQRRKHAKKR